MLRAITGDFAQTDRDSWQMLQQVLRAQTPRRHGGRATRLAGDELPEFWPNKSDSQHGIAARDRDLLLASFS